MFSFKDFEDFRTEVEKYKDFYEKYKSDIFIYPLEYEEVKIQKLNPGKYDELTWNLIIQLVKKQKARELSKIDNCILQKLVNREINAKQIEEERKKCKEDPLYFVSNYIQVPNKFEESEIDKLPDRIKNLIFGDTIKFIPYPIQYMQMDYILKYDRVIAVKSRQVGFTNSACALALHLITFQNNKRIIIFSKAWEEAKKTLREYIKFSYENLPFFLKRKKLKDNEGEFGLGNEVNASYIYAKTSGRKSGRSISATQLILDEAEFIDGIHELQSAAAPTLSATRGKAIVLSTPQMHGSWFFNLVKSAKENKTDQKVVYGYWKFFEDRNEEQYKKQCTLLNYDRQKIKTELEMEQIVPGNTYFSEDILSQIVVKTPLKLKNNSDEDKFLIKLKSQASFIDFYINPAIEPYNKHLYLISFDPFEGGGDANAIAIIDITSFKIAGLGKTKLEELTNVLYLLSSAFNSAKIAIERNKGYKYIRDFINDGLEHLLLPHIGVNKQGEIKQDEKKGYFTDSINKRRALSVLNEYIITYKELPDSLYEEVKYLVIKSSGNIEGLNGDDLVMATSIGLQYAQVLRHYLLEVNSEDKELTKFLRTIYKDKKSDTSVKKLKNITKQLHLDDLTDVNKRKLLYDMYFRQKIMKDLNANNEYITQQILNMLIPGTGEKNNNKKSKARQFLFSYFINHFNKDA